MFDPYGMTTRSSRRATLAARAVVPLLLATAACSPDATDLFSSRASPNGELIAESVMTGDGETARGQLVIRARDGSEQHIDLPDPVPEMFLIWRDDRHLEVWSERQALRLPGGDRLGTVTIVPKAYPLPRDLASAYDRASAKDRRIAVASGAVVASFADRAAGNARRCILDIGAANEAGHDAARVEIAVDVTRDCGRGRPCAGIATVFTLENRTMSEPQVTLTSATISGIPSYNRLPTGSDGTAVRGQFLGSAAATLFATLKGSSVTLDFSRDFFDQVIRYELPLAPAAGAVSAFNSCIGDASPL